MDLDRRSILRDDFSRARRGYDPDEVRQHLKQIADLVEELQQERAMAPVADTAASQVRSIIQAAERSGAELTAAAKQEAERVRAEVERVRDEADAEAALVRTQATVEATERVEMIHEVSGRVLERAEAIERALAELRDEAAALSHAILAEQPAAESVTEDEEAEARAGHTLPASHREDVEARGADVEDVRLIALNMALNGSSREETGAYLKENFEIEDPEALLDGVYAQARA